MIILVHRESKRGYVGNTPLLNWAPPPPKKKINQQKEVRIFVLFMYIKHVYQHPYPRYPFQNHLHVAPRLVWLVIVYFLWHNITVKLIIFQNLSLKTACECLRDHPVGDKCIDRRDFLLIILFLISNWLKNRQKIKYLNPFQ